MRKQRTHLSFIHVCGLDVIHDVNMHIIQHNVDACVRSSWLVVYHIAKDDTRLGRGHLDRRLDVMEGVWSERVRCGTFNKLEIAESCELDRQVLERVVGLVDNENV
jgi:hypothetical protein